MKKLKGYLLYGQSGGPTSVINASAYGIIKEAQANNDLIKDVIVMRHGINGALNEDFYFISEQDEIDIELLKHTILDSKKELRKLGVIIHWTVQHGI